MKVINGKI